MGTISYSVPQSGLPNASEDPKIASALTTLLTLVNGNLDGTNLRPGTFSPAFVTASTSQAIADGHLVDCAAGATITLTPAVQAQITVKANAGVTSASPATVSAGSGLIYGVGTGGSAHSILLGTPQASASFYCFDGTNWVITAGQQDSGWAALTLAGGVTAIAGTGVTPSVRLRGDRVEFKGTLQRQTTAAGAWATIPASPAGMRPTGLVIYLTAIAIDSGFPAWMTVDGTGLMTPGRPNAGAACGLDGAWFSTT